MTREAYQRTQVLLEPRQHKQLRAIARRERRSVSDVVRRLLAAQLAARERRAMEAAARELLPDYRRGADLTAFTALDGEDVT